MRRHRKAGSIPSGIFRKPSPPAADVQDMVCPSQRRFTANLIELFLLGLVQVGGAFEVGAAVLVVGVKK